MRSRETRSEPGSLLCPLNVSTGRRGGANAAWRAVQGEGPPRGASGPPVAAPVRLPRSDETLRRGGPRRWSCQDAAAALPRRRAVIATSPTRYGGCHWRRRWRRSAISSLPLQPFFLLLHLCVRLDINEVSAPWSFRISCQQLAHFPSGLSGPPITGWRFPKNTSTICSILLAL